MKYNSVIWRRGDQGGAAIREYITEQHLTVALQSRQSSNITSQWFEGLYLLILSHYFNGGGIFRPDIEIMIDPWVYFQQ